MPSEGGCLCGAVRYKMGQTPDYASYCHCGMCRKATGAPFAAFVEAPEGRVDWVKREPRVYGSSEGVTRRFCGDCGSSLTFEADGVLFISLGSLDEPEKIAVKCHCYTSTKLPQIILADDLLQHRGPAGGKGGRPIDD